MFDPQRAEAFAPAQKAVLPCGCLGIMIGHTGTHVHFGIEQTECRHHRLHEITSMDKDALITPVGPFEPFGG